MFLDRAQAGHLLAQQLIRYDRPRPLILALPRGGVPVAAEVAQAMNAELDVLIVRKLGVPGNPEFALGAVSENDVLMVDHALADRLGLTHEQVMALAAGLRRDVEKRVTLFRDGRRHLAVGGRNVIIVDDGLATGSTAAAAVTVAKHLGAQHVTLAVPVGSVEAVRWLSTLADDVICLETPDPFYAVGNHYRSFDQVTDEDVLMLLSDRPEQDDSPHSPLADCDVVITTGDVRLDGRLTVPASAHGVVVFAHGSGSSRHSPRNVAVARALNSAGIGTLLLDLLTEDEADDRHNVFDIDLLAERVSGATEWLTSQPVVEGMNIGYFGASTGAAAALVAAAKHPDHVRAIVSRGGRPDLAGNWLPRVKAPTLLIVGGHDYQVLDLNRAAQEELRCNSLVEVVKGATHLFEEPGALAQVSRLAQSWFTQHLWRARRPAFHAVAVTGRRHDDE